MCKTWWIFSLTVINLTLLYRLRLNVNTKTCRESLNSTFNSRNAVGERNTVFSSGELFYKNYKFPLWNNEKITTGQNILDLEKKTPGQYLRLNRYELYSRSSKGWNILFALSQLSTDGYTERYLFCFVVLTGDYDETMLWYCYTTSSKKQKFQRGILIFR